MKMSLIKTICLAALLAGPFPVLADAPGSGVALSIKQYALIFPANIPHLMETIGAHRGELDLTETQNAQVDAIYADVPDRIRPLFGKAKALEIAIANDVLSGVLLEDFGPRLDEREAIKREAAEIHIACINHVHSMLSPEQYTKALDLAGHTGKGA